MSATRVTRTVLAGALTCLLVTAACGGGGASSPSAPSRPASASSSLISAMAMGQSASSSIVGSSAVDLAACLHASADAACFSGARLTAVTVGGAATADAPSGLTAAASGSTVTLTWRAPTGTQPATSYIIEAGSRSGLADLASLPTGSAATTFTASGVPAGTYFVRVRAENGGSVSDPSNEAILIVGAAGCTSAPNAPSGLVTSAAGSTVTLTWTAPPSGCAPTAYILQAGSAASLSNLANSNTGNTATSYVASGVGAGTYYVRVLAANAYGQSSGSNEVVLVVGGSTPSPTSVTGRWVGVAPDGWILDPGTNSCTLEWDFQLDLTQSGTAMTGTVTTRVRKVARAGCDPIGRVESASLMDGAVGSGTLSFSLPGERAGTLNFTGTYTATRMAGRMTATGGGGGSFALNRQ